MSKLFEKIIEFFESKAISLSKKMTMLMIGIISLLLVDNCCGFSYYFVQTYKLDYITSLEDARFRYSKDSVVSRELDRMMVNALNRWTVFNAVSDIFQETFSTTSEAREQQLAREIVKGHNDITDDIRNNGGREIDNFTFFPIAERSPFWHTVCSSLIFVLFLLICVLYLILSPFLHDKDKKNAIIGMCFVIPLLVGIIFLVQWLLSFVPDICGRPGINNLIYVIINILLLCLFAKKSAKKK